MKQPPKGKRFTDASRRADAKAEIAAAEKMLKRAEKSNKPGRAAMAKKAIAGQKARLRRLDAKKK